MCARQRTPGRANETLLRHLDLDLKRKYAPLAESSCVREGLAAYLGLEKDADYCDIAEELLRHAAGFLKAVKQQPGLSRVKHGAVSFLSEDFEC